MSGFGKDYPQTEPRPDNFDDPDPLLARLRTGAWLDAATFPPLKWAVPELIPEGMSLVVGGPKIGKSYLALDVAMAVACGGQVLGKVSVGQPRPVLLLALEDGDRRLQDRCRHLMVNEPIPALFNYMTRIEPGSAVATIEAWLQRLPDADQPLVILDTLGKVLPPTSPGESAYQRDYRVTGRLKRIADDRPGMALMALHHDRKASSDDFVDDISGTNGIAGAVDTLIVISRPRSEDRGLFKVTGRDVVEREYAVQVTPETGWLLVGDDLIASSTAAQTVRATANLGDRSAEIVRFAAKHPEGVRAADVAEAVEITADDAGRYLRRLHEVGKLHKPERGLYAPVLSVRSVRTDEEPTLPSDTTDTTDTGTESPKCAVCGFPLAAAHRPRRNNPSRMWHAMNHQPDERTPSVPSTASVLDQLTGQRVPGGCDDCSAYQTVTKSDGIHVLTVHHDDSCPWLRARENRP